MANFYMKKVGEDTEYNIENHWDGLLYKQFKGLSDYGKIKSVYTESFAETDKLNYYQASKPIRENTDLELTLVFKGDNRRATYDNFVEYISSGEIIYHDDVRNKYVNFILIEAITPSEDQLYGDIKYIIATFKLKNINGQTRNTL